MSRIYITRDENGLIFTKNPVPEEPGSEPRLSRRTYLAFARWLRKNVREEDLKSEIVIYGFLNRYKHDLRDDRVRLLRLIKETKEEDLYRELAYAKKSVTPFRQLSKAIREYSFEIPVYYEEDLYQLFRLYGASEEQAFEWTRAACSGCFKAYCRSRPQKDPVFMLPEELLTFSKTADGLPSRNWICRTFKDEYPLFLNDLERKELRKEKEKPMNRGLFWCTDRKTDPPAFITVHISGAEDHSAQTNVTRFVSTSADHLNHRAEWSKLPKSVTGGEAFNYYPRGRVEIQNHIARIFLNPVLCEDLIVSRIKDIFGLMNDPEIRTIRVIADGSIHYQSEV